MISENRFLKINLQDLPESVFLEQVGSEPKDEADYEIFIEDLETGEPTRTNPLDITQEAPKRNQEDDNLNKSEDENWLSDKNFE